MVPDPFLNKMIGIGPGGISPKTSLAGVVVQGPG